MASWERVMQQAAGAFGEQRHDEAAALYARATRLRPGRVEAWCNLGAVLLAAGRPADAERAWRQAVQRRPDLAMVWLGLGRALGHQHRAEEAEEAFRNALQREHSAEILNDLGSALRDQQRISEATACYREACQIDPDATLPATNLATSLLIDLQFGEARERIDALLKRSLPPAQREELEASHGALEEYARWEAPLARAMAGGALESLVEVAEGRPAGLLDRVPIERLQRCARSLRDHAEDVGEPIRPQVGDQRLGGFERNRLEALMMIPIAEDGPSCRNAMATMDVADSEEWEETRGMHAAVRAAVRHGGLVGSASRDEALLRICHALACAAFPAMLPGQFKLARNKSGDPRFPKARPERVAESMRHLFERLLPAVPAGMARGALLFMGISDIHPFADGNGRVALALLNREMERAGEEMVLLDGSLGVRGRLGQALQSVRVSGGDMRPLVEVLREGQRCAARLQVDVSSESKATG